MTNTWAEKKRVRVLSIDGGGIRGVIPARILAELEHRTQQPVSKLFDLLVGTSTGGLLVLALTQPEAKDAGRPARSAADMVRFYEQLGTSIFAKPFFHRIASADGLLRSRYPETEIEAVLASFFGETRLKDALAPVLVPSYEMGQRSPFFFRSSRARERDDYDYPMRVAARATSAAPTYFPPEQVVSGTGTGHWLLIDGGVFANNPAACAYAEARTMFPAATEFTLVSLGTGKANQSPVMKNAASWGVAQWARPILDTVLDGVSSTVEYQLSQMLPPREDGTARYFRLQTTLKAANAPMDDASPDNLEELKQAAERMLEERAAELETIAVELRRTE